MIGFLKEEDARRLRAELLARAAGIHRTPASSTASATAPATVPTMSADPALGTSTTTSAIPAPATASGTGSALLALGTSAYPAPGTSTTTSAIPARASSTPPPADAAEAPEEQVYELTIGLLVHSLLRSPAVWLSVLLVVGVGAAVIITREWSILASAGAGLVAAGSYLFQRFAGEFGFRAALSPDGIRLRHGLLETRAQTIPPGRVQAVSLTQGPLWRGPDWWRVRVNVAGYGQTSNATQTQTLLLPVGTRNDAHTALWLVLPDLGTPDPVALLDEGLSGMFDARQPSTWFTNAPRRARWVDPLSWRRDAYAVTDRALLLRGGRLVRRLVVVPHERTQSLAVAQGPLQRRLDVATFTVHSTAGPVVPMVRHLASDDAAHLLAEQAQRAQAARAAAGPERWMEPTGA
jgi:putative membrane protein